MTPRFFLAEPLIQDPFKFCAIVNNDNSKSTEVHIVFKKIALLTLLLLCSFFTYARTVHVYCSCPVKDVKGQTCSCPTSGSPLVGKTSFAFGNPGRLYIALHCNQALKQHKIAPDGQSKVRAEGATLYCSYDPATSGKHHRTYYCTSGITAGTPKAKVEKIHCKVGGHH